MGLDPAKVDRLLTRVQREVDEGLSPAVQVAIGYQGEVVLDETFGAPDDSRFVVFSATKGLVAGALWRLIDRGDLDVAAPVASYLPSFATNGKDVVTVEQVLTHTGGFPYAPLGPPAWNTREGRLAAFEKWRLTLDPGVVFLYHPTAGHWVLAEVMAEITGLPYADAIAELVTEPLGLPRLLAIPLDEQQDIVETVGIGAPPTPAEMLEAFGVEIDISTLIPPDVALNALLSSTTPMPGRWGCPAAAGSCGRPTSPCSTRPTSTTRRTCGPTRSWPPAPVTWPCTCPTCGAPRPTGPSGCTSRARTPLPVAAASAGPPRPGPSATTAPAASWPSPTPSPA